MDHFIKTLAEDSKLLALPEGVDVIFSPDGNGAALDVFTAEQMEDYARASVAHATEKLNAENEALRAELREAWSAVDSKAGWEWKKRAEQAEARAERLAEALREAEEYIDGVTPNWASKGQRVLDIIRAALCDHDQEVGND